MILLCCYASHCTTSSVQTSHSVTHWSLSTHACELSGSMVCTLSAMRFCCSFVAWGVTLHYIQCALVRQLTCMCTELRMPHTLNVMQFGSCFVALGFALHYIQCSNYPSTQYTCMCSELEDDMHTTCKVVCAAALLLGASHCTAFSVQMIRQLSTHACELRGSMVYTLSAMRPCCCYVAWGVTALHSVCRLSVNSAHMPVQ